MSARRGERVSRCQLRGTRGSPRAGHERRRGWWPVVVSDSSMAARPVVAATEAVSVRAVTRQGAPAQDHLPCLSGSEALGIRQAVGDADTVVLAAFRAADAVAGAVSDGFDLSKLASSCSRSRWSPSLGGVVDVCIDSPCSQPFRSTRPASTTAPTTRRAGRTAPTSSVQADQDSLRRGVTRIAPRRGQHPATRPRRRGRRDRDYALTDGPNPITQKMDAGPRLLCTYRR